MLVENEVGDRGGGTASQHNKGDGGGGGRTEVNKLELNEYTAGELHYCEKETTSLFSDGQHANEEEEAKSRHGKKYKESSMSA